MGYILKIFLAKLNFFFRIVSLRKSQLEFINDITLEMQVLENLKKYVKNLEFDNSITCNTSDDKIIWQLWLQGDNLAPPIVKACFDSIKQNMQGYKIVVLNEDSVHQYIEIPDIILKKREEGIISNAHYSDIIRTFLLAKFGGIWIDSTVYLSGTIDNLLSGELFLFSTPTVELRGLGGLVASSWFIYSKRGNVIFNYLQQVLIRYWESENKISHYYLFHFIFASLLNEYKICSEEWNKVPYISSIPPHYMQKILDSQFDPVIYESIINMSNIHKLTHYSDKAKYTFNSNSLYNFIISKYEKNN